MRDLIALALEKWKAEKGIRERIAPGNHEVDAVVHVHGTVKVGKDYTTVPTVSVPLKETLALFVAYCGCTREAAKAALLRAAGEAIAATGKGKGSLEDALPVVEETLQTVKDDVLARLARQPRKGTVSVKGLTVEEVND